MHMTDNDPRTTEFGLGDLVRIIARLRWYIVAGALTGAAIALLVSLLMIRVYRAEVTAMPAGDAQAAGGLARLAGQFGGLAALAGVSVSSGDDSRDEAIAVLGSRRFALEMIDDLDLLPVLFSKRWDPASRAWRAESGKGPPTNDEAWRIWDKSIRTVFDDSARGLITVRVEWRDRELAAAWANEMINRLNRTMRMRRLAELDQNLRFLNDELEQATMVELRSAIAQVMQAQVSERMLANVRQEFALKVIDPALPADADRPIRPRPALYGALGLSSGVLIGFALGLVVLYSKARPRP